MNLQEIDWDFNTAGNWPSAIKLTILGLIVITVIAIGFYYDTSEAITSLDNEKQKEQLLKVEFKDKHKKAINLHEYQEQLSQIEASLYQMIRQLPTEEEVASLLVDISQTGLANGLNFKLFKPEASINKDFYSELPISIEVSGHYVELGMFISGLASLPRIVTIHNIIITPDGKEGSLLMSAVIKIYNESKHFASADSAKKKRGNK